VKIVWSDYFFCIFHIMIFLQYHLTTEKNIIPKGLLVLRPQ